MSWMKAELSNTAIMRTCCVLAAFMPRCGCGRMQRKPNCGKSRNRRSGRMKRFLIVAAVPLAALAWHAVQAGEEAPGTDHAFDVRQSMIDGVNPPTLALWDVGNNAMSEDGTLALDPALLTEEDWMRITEAAYQLGEESHRMASGTHFAASGPNMVEGEVPEGVASRRAIQAATAADPAAFRGQP